MDGDHIATRHHKQTAHHQTAFAKDVNFLITVFNELDHLFLENSNELLTLDTKDIVNEDAVKSILSAKKLGIVQCKTFVANRIINSKLPFTNILTRNNLSLLHKPKKRDLKSFKTSALKKIISVFLDYILLVNQEKQI